MTFTHALATNNYGSAKFIVATSAANGTHTTLAAAMTAASVGDTIFLRDSVTENVTITPGVNIAAWSGSSLNTPSITGKLTMTGAGTSTISGINLITNSDFALAVTGSAASIINLNNCYLNCSNNTGISYTSSSSSSAINVFNCKGNIGTTGIGLFSSTGAGIIRFYYCFITNTGASTTASSTNAALIDFRYCDLNIPFSTSSTGTLNFESCKVRNDATNTICVTTAGTGISFAENSDFLSGTASVLSIGAGTQFFVVTDLRVDSSNTNPITGAGTLRYGNIFYTNTVGNNVTTNSSFNKGSWTPVLSFGGATTGITYSDRTGQYYIEGNVLYFTFSFLLSSKGSATGAANITGLPFAANSSGGNFSWGAGFISRLTYTAGYTNTVLTGNNNSATLSLYQVGSGNNGASITDTNFSDTTLFVSTGFYFLS